MKLYATVTSERASKGQGGNDYIHVSITDSKDQEAVHVYIDRDGRIDIWNRVTGEHFSTVTGLEDIRKGEKKKGVYACKLGEAECCHCQDCTS